jgi:hypothetical protein
MTQNIRLSPADMDRLSRLAFTLGHNDKTRAQFAELVSQVDAGAAKSFSDVFLEKKIDTAIKEIRDERLAEKMQNAAAMRERQKANVIQRRKLSADQVASVEKILTHYGMTDWEAGADIYATRNPAPNPDLQPPPEILHGGMSWSFPTVPGTDGKMLDFNDFRKDMNGATRNAAVQVITEFKRNRLSPAFTRAA